MVFTREQLVGNGQKSGSSTANFRLKLSIFGDIGIPVEQIVSRNSHVLEGDFCIVNPVEAHFISHVFNGDSRHLLQVVIPHPDKDAMNALVFSIHDKVGEDDNVLGMNGAIGDPVFLSQWRGRVHNELLGFLVIRGGRLHFHGIVAVT